MPANAVHLLEVKRGIMDVLWVAFISIRHCDGGGKRDGTNVMGDAKIVMCDAQTVATVAHDGCMR